ncbi:MAG: phage protein GemA/Gp16 family protein [Treponemataceae bacterium]
MNKRWISNIHIAKNQLRLSDENYIAILLGCAGVESSKEIETFEQYATVMKVFTKLGYKQFYKMKVDPQSERSPDFISEKQEYYIKGLWKLASRKKDEDSLRQLCKRITGVEDVSWCQKKHAQKLILALRSITSDAGFNPDSKD